MNPIRAFVVALFLFQPYCVMSADLPSLGSDTAWYVHANFDRMRNASDDQALYEWFRRNVIDDLEEEFGEGSVTRFEGVTVFGGKDGRGRLGIVLHGVLSQGERLELTDQWSARLLEDREQHQVFEIAPLSVAPEELSKALGGTGLFLAFGEHGQTLVTTSDELLAEFLAAGAYFENELSPDLLVIRATDALMRGGVDTSSMSAMGGSYESQVFRNVEQAGVALADIGGRYELRIEMLASSIEKAQALGSIVQGLIGLHAMSEADADLAFLSSLQVRTDDDRLSLDLQLTPGELMELLD